MVPWLGRLVRGGRREARLPHLLADYPPYRQPYAGPGRMLGLPQAEANLAYLLKNKSTRLSVIGGLLAEFDLKSADGLAGTDPTPFLQRLGRWTAEEWPSTRDEALLPIEVWLNSRREGREIVFSLIMDVAILLGEMVLCRRDDYRWALDLDQTSADDDMLSWHRPIVLRPADGVVPAIRFDFEDVARSAYVQCGKPGYNVRRDVGRGVLDAISGAHESWWREQAAARPG